MITSIYSKDGKTASDDPILEMAQGTASVPENLVEDVVDAADECPGECIFIDIE